MGYKLKSFASVVGMIKVEPFDGHSDMVIALDHRTIEDKGKYRDKQICKIDIKTYELIDLSTQMDTLGFGESVPIAEYAIIQLQPMERIADNARDIDCHGR